MEEKYPVVWTPVTHDLKRAALLPQKRNEFILNALQQMLLSIPAAGTALIWPCQHRKIPWKVFYAGAKQKAMYRWLSVRLDASIDVMTGVLQHDLNSGQLDMPPAILSRLYAAPASLKGLWILWNPLSPAEQGPFLESIQHINNTLEALLEVEEKEQHYFSTSSILYDQELIEALAHGDVQALSAFLSLTRVVAKADLAFWAKASQNAVELTGQLGARHSGFGFALAPGQGVGGRVVAHGAPIMGDYLNSPYREPHVCDIIDNEQIRSGIALPIRYNTLPDTHAHVGAVLYATRRTVEDFSLAERLLVQRLITQVEPLPFEIRPVPFFAPDIQHLSDHKTAWYDIVMHANQIEVVEEWASQLIKGRVIVTGGNGSPYVFAHSERLEQMKAAYKTPAQQGESIQVLSLAAPGVPIPGKIYLSASIALPPPQWPDFFADLIVACNIVIARMEQTQDQLDHRRERWLRTLLKGELTQYVEQDGYRLGLPVARGQLWVLAWHPELNQKIRSPRKRMIAESVVLEHLKSPLIFLEDDIAVVLLEEQAPQPPSKVRDALLKYYGTSPLWIVHGGRYRSLHELKLTLAHTMALAQKACRERYREYLLDIYTFGLDSLLENPRMTEDLSLFARRLLSPLIEHDAANSSQLTETFVLTQTLGSARTVADHLGVHVNTIRYRLHRAEDILGTNKSSSKEQIAMALAAFIWQRFQTISSQLSS